jgi:hypothetical protein
MEKTFNVNKKQLQEITIIIPEEIMNFLKQHVVQYHKEKTENGMINSLANYLKDALELEQRLDWLDKQNRPVYTASFFAYAISFDPRAGYDGDSSKFLKVDPPDDFKIRTGERWNLNHLDVEIEDVIGEGNMQYGCNRNFKINVEVWD